MPIDYSKFANIGDSDDEDDKKKAKEAKDKDIKGQLVEAHGLTGAAQLNGLIGRVVNRQGDRIGVDFGPPHGSKALRPANLRSVSPASALRREEERKEKELKERREWEGRSRPSRKEREESDDDDDGDVGTWYKHREWKPSAAAAAPAPTPVKITGQTPPTPSTPNTGSAWNTAGTWEEKDVLPWTKSTLTSKIKGLSQGFDQGSVSFTAVEVTGDASVGFIRGKKRYLFDLTIKADYEAVIAGTGASGSDGEKKGTGAVSITDVDQSESPPYDMSVEVKTDVPQSARDAVKAAIGASSTAVKKTDCLCAKLHGAIAEWKAEFEKL